MIVLGLTKFIFATLIAHLWSWITLAYIESEIHHVWARKLRHTRQIITQPWKCDKMIFPCLIWKIFFYPGTDTTMLKDEYPLLRTLELCRNRYFLVFMENVLLTWHKQTNPLNFFHMTLPSVEGIVFTVHLLLHQYTLCRWKWLIYIHSHWFKLFSLDSPLIGHISNYWHLRRWCLLFNVLMSLFLWISMISVTSVQHHSLPIIVASKSTSHSVSLAVLNRMKWHSLYHLVIVFIYEK